MNFLYPLDVHIRKTVHRTPLNFFGNSDNAVAAAIRGDVYARLAVRRILLPPEICLEFRQIFVIGFFLLRHRSKDIFIKKFVSVAVDGYADFGQ